MAPKRKDRFAFFRVLTQLDNEKRAAAVLKVGLDKDQTALIAELALNLLAGNIKLKGDEFIELKGRKRLIRKLAVEGASHKARLSVIRNNTAAVLEVLKAALN